MNPERRSLIHISSDAVLLFIIFVFIILFVGTPDLYDVLLYRLSDGKVEIPKAEKK